ncbi:MAG: segregation/condensation protein A [Phycisphaeraceae bacterium]
MTSPMQDYRVELEAYSGPLDLLLFLVKRHEVDLYDIPIAQLTEQYLDHLKFIQQIDVERAGEFLVMAATLLEIKSRMLLPRAGVEGEGADDAAADVLNETDPRYDLVQQLLAYKRFKDAAMALDERRQDWLARFAYHPARHDAATDDAQTAPPIEFDLEDAQVFDLCAAFARILESIGESAHHEVVYDDTPIALHAEDILDRLERDGVNGSMTLQDIFVGRDSRSEMIGLFLAVLELVRQRKVRVVQDHAGAEIRVALVPPQEQTEANDEHDADWRDPETGQVQYDWPTDEARQRAERRAARAAEGRSGQPHHDLADEVIDVDGDDDDPTPADPINPPPQA